MARALRGILEGRLAAVAANLCRWRSAPFRRRGRRPVVFLRASAKVESVLRVEDAGLVCLTRPRRNRSRKTRPLPARGGKSRSGGLALRAPRNQRCARECPCVQIRRALRPDGLFLGFAWPAPELPFRNCARSPACRRDRPKRGGASPRVPAVHGCARSRRPCAAGGFCTPGRRYRRGDGALRHDVSIPDARPLCAPWAPPTAWCSAGFSGPPGHPGHSSSRRTRSLMRSAFPMRDGAASARPSTRSGSRDGHRRRRSSSHSKPGGARGRFRWAGILESGPRNPGGPGEADYW